MSMKHTESDIKNIDRACDFLAQACYYLNETEDWVALSALHAIEGMMDDLGDRHAELQGIVNTIKDLQRKREAMDEYGFEGGEDGIRD